MDVVFIDTNCWVYASNPARPFYEVAQRHLADFQKRNYELCSCPQIIKEYTWVLTSEGIFPYSEIKQKAEFIRDTTTFLPETSGTIAEFDKRVEKHRVKGKSVYDCSIVATMIYYDVFALLTHNVADFSPRYEGSIRVIPLL